VRRLHRGWSSPPAYLPPCQRAREDRRALPPPHEAGIAARAWVNQEGVTWAFRARTAGRAAGPHTRDMHRAPSSQESTFLHRSTRTVSRRCPESRGPLAEQSSRTRFQPSYRGLVGKKVPEPRSVFARTPDLRRGRREGRSVAGGCSQAPSGRTCMAGCPGLNRLQHPRRFTTSR